MRSYEGGENFLEVDQRDMKNFSEWDQQGCFGFLLFLDRNMLIELDLFAQRHVPTFDCEVL